MAVYSFTWSSVISPGGVISEWNKHLYPGRNIGEAVNPNGAKDVADYIKNSKEDTFFFCLSNYAGPQAVGCHDQKPQWEKWVEENQLQEYVKICSAGISNPIHQERKYSLYVVIMQSKDHPCPVELKG